MQGREYGRELTERPRATAHDALQPRRYGNRPLTQEEVDVVASASTRNGVIAAVASCFASSGLVYAANALSPRFRGALGVSGKAALVVTPTAGAFFLRSHLTIAAARADPESFVASNVSASTAEAAAATPTAATPPQRQLTLSQTLSNAIYNHPFKFIGSLALPCYGGVFYRESTHPSTASMPLSQRLIHTRVYGQMIAVLSTVSVMAFVKGMEADGGSYHIVDGRLMRSEHIPHSNVRHWYSEHGLPPPQQAAAGVERHRQRKRGDDGQARLAEMEARRLEDERRAAEELDTGPSYHLLVPLIYAPLLPVARIGLRGRIPPQQLTQLSMGIIALALSHAGYIMFSDSTVVGFKGDA